MSKLSHSNPAFESVGVCCERCGEWFDGVDADLEAYETLDILVCPLCATEALDENGQFWVGA